MTVSWPTVKRRLKSDEPDYAALAASIDEKALAGLARLARDADPLMAAKATYLASLVASPASVQVIAVAAQRAEAPVRVAAAAALSNVLDAEADMSDESLSDRRWVRDRSAIAVETLRKLVDDPDPGVRKFAEKSARGRPEVAADGELV